MRRNRIPVEPFCSLVRDYIAKVDMGEVPTGGWAAPTRTCSQTYSAIEAVAEWSGVKWDTLAGILNGKRQSIDFDFADRVICSTLGPGAWHTEPELHEQYMNVDLYENDHCEHQVKVAKGQRKVDACTDCRANQDRVNKQKRAKLRVATC